MKLNCGHTNNLYCWEKGKKACDKLCSGIRECGHECRNVCSECRGENTNDNFEHVGRCKDPCARTLICGHVCGVSPCHDANSCPPCTSKNCDIKCEHSTCTLACNDVCYACSEPCGWRCHCGSDLKCNQYCATPCIRLPCDNRCTRTLNCGHQCPSLCGEQCPSMEYCVTCIKEGKEYTKKRCDQDVDFITMKKLKDLCEDEEGDLPIIVLPCQHAFTVDTLDGHMGMETFYTRDDDGNWDHVSALDDLKRVGKGPYDMEQRSLPHCILCKKTIYSINRYKRITAFNQIVTIQRKWVCNAQQRHRKIMKAIHDVNELLSQSSDMKTLSKLEQLRYYRLIRKKISAARRFKEEMCENRAPTSEAYNKELSNIMKENSNLNQHNLEDVKPDKLPYLLAQEAEMNCLLMKCRFVCYTTHLQLETRPESRLHSNQTNENNLTDDQRKIAMLDCINSTRKEAHCVMEKLVEYCDEHHYRKRRNDIFKMYAQSMHKLMYDLERIGNLPDSKGDVPCYFTQRQACATEVEEIARKCTSLKELSTHLRQILSGTVTDEERKMIFEAMSGDIGRGIGSFGGHWFRCKNGHTYTIGECGGAMETIRCPECGLQIGGRNHELAAGNSVNPDFDRIVRGMNNLG